MKRLYFVRHGLSEMNVAKKYNGSSNTPLTPKGKEQATATGKWARDNGLVFDIILSSPLDRAHETAKYIATEINYPHESILIHPDLKERHFGVVEGLPYEQVPITHQDYLTNPFVLDHIEDVESIADLQYRAKQMYEYIQTLPHESILLVSHGAFGRAFERAVKNMPITEFGTPLDNAQIIRLI